jgi:selenocysteine lyase/cysteine desulfurase
VAVVGSATAGFIQALSSFDFVPGDSIVTTRCDYTSNQIQYLALATRLGVEVVHAEDLPEGGVDPQSVHEIIGRRRPAAGRGVVDPTNSGLVQDVEGVGAVCEQTGVPVHRRRMSGSRADPDRRSPTPMRLPVGDRAEVHAGDRAGIGFMFASDRALRRGDYPLFVDMRGARWTAPAAYEVDETARRYEDWEFPYALVLGQAAAAQYALEVGIETAQARAWSLAARLRQALGALPRARVLDRGATQCAIVTMTVEGKHADAIVRGLKEQGSTRCRRSASMASTTSKRSAWSRRFGFLRITTTRKPRWTRRSRRFARWSLD